MTERNDDGPVIHLPGSKVNRLRPNAVGLVDITFMSVATAAPIAAMTGNVPISVGFGNGPFTPAGYMVATVILSLFALGYSAMAKNITATGAFYGFVSFGLGRVPGLGAGALTTMAYVVFEAAVVGLFSFFAHNFFAAHLGIEIPWLVFALAAIVANAAASYFKISIAAGILGAFLITEIVMLLVLAFSVIFSGGGPEGWSIASLNPINAFQNVSAQVPDLVNPGQTIAVAGSAGFGLFLAFWSWVGFESAAMYGEESKNPRKIIPQATMLSVIGIGVFYVFISWSAIVGTGPERAMAIAQDTANSGNIFFGPLEQHVGSWAVVLFEFLLMTGSYACCMAFHNCASRYIYAIGREDVIPGLASTVGKVHHRYASPYVAGFLQSIFAAIIVIWFAATGRDPYIHLFALLGILGTTAIVLVQIATAVACIAYFHVHGIKRPGAHWFRTLLAPALGGVGMVYMTYLLIENASFAAGTAADDLVFRMIPWVIGFVGAGGVIFALVVRRWAPDRYQLLGRVIMDVRERDDPNLTPVHARHARR